MPAVVLFVNRHKGAAETSFWTTSSAMWFYYFPNVEIGFLRFAVAGKSRTDWEAGSSAGVSLLVACFYCVTWMTGRNRRTRRTFKAWTRSPGKSSWLTRKNKILFLVFYHRESGPHQEENTRRRISEVFTLSFKLKLCEQCWRKKKKKDTILWMKWTHVHVQSLSTSLSTVRRTSRWRWWQGFNFILQMLFLFFNSIFMSPLPCSGAVTRDPRDVAGFYFLR